MQDWEHREELSVHFLLLGNVLLRGKVHKPVGPPWQGEDMRL